jgi:hypothetical protein
VSERTIGIGYVALALALTGCGCAAAGDLLVAVADLFLCAGVGAAVALRRHHLGEHSPPVMAGEPPPSWTPYGCSTSLVPFMRISRSVSRFALMVQLSAGVLAGIGLAGLMAKLARQPSNRRNSAALVSLAALPAVILGAEYWVAPYPLSPPDTPAYYATLAAQEDDRAVLNLPMNYDRPGYLLYQTVHGKPLTVAYISRDDPRTLTERTPLLQQLRHLGPDIVAADLGAVGLTMLNDLGVGTVVLDRYKMPGGDERIVTEAVAEAVFAGVAPAYADERITVYAVPPVTTPAAYVQLGALNWGPLTAADATRYRVLTGPAAVQVAHAPDDAVLAITYRSTPDVATQVLAADGVTPLVTLPPAAEGATVAVPLVELPASNGGERSLILAPDAAGEVRIEQLILR